MVLPLDGNTAYVLGSPADILALFATNLQCATRYPHYILI